MYLIAWFRHWKYTKELKEFNAESDRLWDAMHLAVQNSDRESANEILSILEERLTKRYG
jgi:hypothetical protein